MFRFLIFFLPVLGSLQNGFARPSTTEMEGIFFEYVPPPVKTDTDLFVALLEPTSGSNATVAQFMHHLKHTTYASAFMTEIFTLAKGMHLFTNDVMANPSVEDRRIAFAVGKLWTTLTGMQTINRLALRISNETSLRYLRNEDRNGTLKFAFSKLNDAVLADPSLREAYAEQMKNLHVSVLPPLLFVKINLKKLISIDEKLIEEVWPNSTMFDLIAHRRFSQHLETKISEAAAEDYENVLMAHVLVDAAWIPDWREMAQKVYDEALVEVVKNNFQFLERTRYYFEFDVELFSSINKILALPEYSTLAEKLTELKKNYPPVPVPEG